MRLLIKPKDWQARPLDRIYPIVFMDATILKIRVERTVKKIACYIMPGISLDEQRDYRHMDCKKMKQVSIGLAY